MSELTVQKYGGKCLAGVDAVKGVARRIADHRKTGGQLLVVVSAMGQTTDELIRLAYQVSPKPNRRELDMLLTTGERVSMALLSMALHDLGVPAISFTGSQAGVLTDDSHSQARILNINAPRVHEALERGQVVVLAGFQGVSPTRKEVTTLGRGGSDTTAVAMAAALGARRCEILKDVAGIYSADPKSVPTAFVYSELTTASVRHMCFWGAKVLHARAIELAEKLSVPLFVGSAQLRHQGTLILKEITTMFEKEKVLSVNSHAKVAQIQIPAASVVESFTSFTRVLSQQSLPLPLILWSDWDGKTNHMLVTSDEESLNAMLAAAEGAQVISPEKQMWSSVTLTGYGLHSPALIERALQHLADQGVRVSKTLSNADGFTLLIKPESRELALQTLHQLVR